MANELGLSLTGLWHDNGARHTWPTVAVTYWHKPTDDRGFVPITVPNGRRGREASRVCGLAAKIPPCVSRS